MEGFTVFHVISSPYTHSIHHQLFFFSICLSFSLCPFLPSPLHLSFLVFCSPPLKSFFLSGLQSFWFFSPSVSVLDGKSKMLEWNQPHFCSVCVCVCVCLCACGWVCVCAHAWASRAVKVRLIHWLQLRGVERSAEFNSYQFGPLPLRNAHRLAKFLLRQTACFSQGGVESSARFQS